jgi:G-protein alpha subunit
MLLGQGEAGKSTLRKQFQLYYTSDALDAEKPSWKPVVLFNIIKAIRMIFDELDYQLAFPESSPEDDLVRAEISKIRRNLLPLVAIEDTLASELSGGVSISGCRSGVCVRTGWQALVTPNLNWSGSENRKLLASNSKVCEVANLAAKTLAGGLNEVRLLWNHPYVKKLMELRKLRLEESAPLYVCTGHGY